MAAHPDRPWLAFWLASISGLAEPIGALVALFFLNGNNGNGNNNGGLFDLKNVLSFVSGVMITVSIWELYPEAIKSIIITTTNTRNNTNTNTNNTTIRSRMIKYYHYYRSIIWGTITGACLMIATELYL
jgi:hypothetical protein